MSSPHPADSERAEPILNPIAWVQFQLGGGIKRFWGVCGLYAGALVFFNIFIYRGLGDSTNLVGFASGSLVFTLFIAGITLVIVGAGVINRAILRDFTSDMITSHRSTAMTGRSVVLGYLLGPNMTLLAITAVNLLAASVLSELAGQPFYAPVIVIGCVSGLACLTWSLSVLSGLSYRGKLSVAALGSPIIFVVLISPLAPVLAAHPGVALLLNYRLIGSPFANAAIGVKPQDAQAVVVSIMFQAMMSLIFCMAAARKFRRDDVSAFSMPMAYILLALSTLLCAVGIEQFGDVPIFRRAGAELTSLSTQTLSALVSLALVALLPISQAALESAQWAKRKACDPHFVEPRPRPRWEAVCFVAIIMFGIMAVAARSQFEEALKCRVDMTGMKVGGYLLCSFILTMLTISGVLRFTYSYVRNGMWILILLLVATWVLPMIGDLLLEVAQERTTNERSMLFTSSPVGMWVLLLTNGQGPYVWGLISQAVIAAAAQVLALKSRR